MLVFRHPVPNYSVPSVCTSHRHLSEHVGSYVASGSFSFLSNLQLSGRAEGMKTEDGAKFPEQDVPSPIKRRIRAQFAREIGRRLLSPKKRADNPGLK